MNRIQTEAERRAEEIEGQRLIALFSKDINANPARSTAGRKSPIELLIQNFPVLEANREFFRKMEAYSGRSDLKARYSQGQIKALAATEIVMARLDMPPRDFHGMFTYCCIMAGTGRPPKLNIGKKRVVFQGLDFSRFL